MIRRAFALLMFASSVSAAPVPKEVRRAEVFEGTWKVVALNNDEEYGNGQSHWTIDANGALQLHDGTTFSQEAPSNIRIAFDPKTKSVDYTQTSDGRNYPGIYQLSGDTLKMCYRLTGDLRPTTVVAGPDLNLWILKRVRPEGKR